MTAREDGLSAEDGLVTRESGEWAKEKLFYVSRYMDIFTKGMSRKWGQRGYVDLMAGPGRCHVRETGEEFAGSPVLASQMDGFDRLIFVEQDPACAQALEQRTAHLGERRVHIAGNCNDARTIARIRDQVPPSMLTLAFIDHLGLDVPFSTIAALTAERRMDLAITFQVSDLTRNVANALSPGPHADRFDAYFGDEGWRDVVARFERGETDRADLPTALADYYGERLRSIGYVVLEQLNRVMRNNRNAPLYRMLLAGKHERASDFFRKISTRTLSGQRGLF